MQQLVDNPAAGELIGRAIRAEEAGGAPAGLIETARPVRQAGGRGPWLQVLGPYRCEWNVYELPVEGLADDLDGLRIVHLTDMHFRGLWGTRGYKAVARRVREAGADLVLITGDFVDDKMDAVRALKHVLRFVDGMTARLGVWAILGNHDGDLIAPYLAQKGVGMMQEQVARIPVAAGAGGREGSAGIELLAMAGVSRNDWDWDLLESLGEKRDGWARIVMTHYPDSLRRLASVRPDLILAGHTHGGQICLPGGKPILRHDSLPRRLCRGVHRVGGSAGAWLVANRGLGFSSLPLRLWCPTEVIEVVLKKAPAAARAGE